MTICQAGPRWRQTHQLLEDCGRTGATVLEGGVNAWQGTGGEVEQGRPKWGLERQVRLVSGSLVVTGVMGNLYYPKAPFFSRVVVGGQVFTAVTNSCAIGNVLSRLPDNKGSRSDIEPAGAALTRR